MVYSNCQCSSAFCLSLTYCSIYSGLDHLLGKRCVSLWLFTGAVFFCAVFFGMRISIVPVPDHCLIILLYTLYFDYKINRPVIQWLWCSPHMLAIPDRFLLRVHFLLVYFLKSLAEWWHFKSLSAGPSHILSPGYELLCWPLDFPHMLFYVMPS